MEQTTGKPQGVCVTDSCKVSDTSRSAEAPVTLFRRPLTYLNPVFNLESAASLTAQLG